MPQGAGSRTVERRRGAPSATGFGGCAGAGRLGLRPCGRVRARPRAIGRVFVARTGRRRAFGGLGTIRPAGVEALGVRSNSPAGRLGCHRLAVALRRLRRPPRRPRRLRRRSPSRRHGRRRPASAASASGRLRRPGIGLRPRCRVSAGCELCSDDGSAPPSRLAAPSRPLAPRRRRAAAGPSRRRVSRACAASPRFALGTASSGSSSLASSSARCGRFLLPPRRPRRGNRRLRPRSASSNGRPAPARQRLAPAQAVHLLAAVDV